jgi:hypothetical protein
LNVGDTAGQIIADLERNKKIADKANSGKYGDKEQGGGQSLGNVKGGKGSKAMSQALEQFSQDRGGNSDPIFSRGAELEITTMQDVEMLKAHLAQLKIHIPSSALERGIIMPRDLESNTENYPKVLETLLINPFKTDKNVVKRGRVKAGGKDGKNKRLMKLGNGTGKQAPELAATGGGKLLINEKQEHKVFEFGNFPVLDTGKPRGGQYRMKLCADADWTGRDKDVDPEEKKNDDL